MKEINLEICDFVCSMQGHDKGKIYIVIKIIDENFVLISDGKSHGINKPKRKRKKHLKNLNKNSTIIKEFLVSDKKIDNSQIFGEINKFKKEVLNG